MGTFDISTTILSGVTANPVTIRVCPGSPAPVWEGWRSEASAKETRVRVHQALRTIEHFPEGAVERARIIAMTSPSGQVLDKSPDPGADLAVVAGFLKAHLERVSVKWPLLTSNAVSFFGEVDYAGDVRPVRGALARAELARREGRTVVCAEGNAIEASLAGGHVFTVRHIRDLQDVWTWQAKGFVPPPGPHRPKVEPADLADIVGQDDARRVIEAAASDTTGQVPVVLIEGPTGVGRTMLSRRVPGILPELEGEDYLEVVRAYSAAGLTRGDNLPPKVRPFRAPHCTTSEPALVGGVGRNSAPGEVHLAHHGVLMLDLIEDFSLRAVGAVGSAINQGSSRGMPCRPAMVIATAHLCPCGAMPERCRCTADSKARHKARVEKHADYLAVNYRATMDPVTLEQLQGPRRGVAANGRGEEGEQDGPRPGRGNLARQPLQGGPPRPRGGPRAAIRRG